MDKPRSELDRYLGYVDESLRVLKRLDRTTIAHLLRATTPSEIDGFPPGNPESSIHACDAVNRPTELAAIARVENLRTQNDQLLEAAIAALTSLAELSGHAVMINKRVDIVIHAGDKIKNETPAHCHACHRPVERTAADPIRNGYCYVCRKDFDRNWKNQFSADDQPTARRFFEEQRPKFEGHLESACEMCAYNAGTPKAGDSVVSVENEGERCLTWQFSPNYDGRSLNHVVTVAPQSRQTAEAFADELWNYWDEHLEDWDLGGARINQDAKELLVRFLKERGESVPDA